uniref:Uncharacterized protein n=1 Tax=Rhizophora mucronata TaxID=61149 RepID=A0A2P2NT12_RHIMU
MQMFDDNHVHRKFQLVPLISVLPTMAVLALSTF